MSTIATGYRTASAGALNAVGTNGYAWSSSSYGGADYPHNASNLNFNAGNVNPLNANNRSNGFPVRCVQHLCGAVFLFFRTTKTAYRPEWCGPWLVSARRVDSAIRCPGFRPAPSNAGLRAEAIPKGQFFIPVLSELRLRALLPSIHPSDRYPTLRATATVMAEP